MQSPVGDSPTGRAGTPAATTRFMHFRDRREAGCLLGRALARHAGSQPLILALPRGGVPVAYEIARALAAELDIWVVRKIGAPWQPELGLGAVAEDGTVYLPAELASRVGLSFEEASRAVEARLREVKEWVQRFRGEEPRPDLRDRCVILVDDGIATGGSVRAAIRSIRAGSPAAIILAVPVAAAATLRELAPEVEDITCLSARAHLFGVGLAYERFEPVPDAEVIRLLARSTTGVPGRGAEPPGIGD